MPATDISGASVSGSPGVGGTGDGRRLRWAQHRADRRAAFVRASVRAVDDFGPAASAEQVAHAAEVSRTVLYRYFRDKDDLRRATADQIVEQVVASVVPHLTPDAEATPREVITSTVGSIIGLFADHPNYYLFLRDQRTGSLGAVESTLADRVATLLREVMIFFGLDGDDAQPGAHGMVGYVESSCAWWLACRGRPGELTRERFTEIVCGAIWHLLDGVARGNGITISYDEPLPFAALTRT